MSNLYGQCTWYAWGRAYELTGIKLPCRNDAKTWYSVASNNGYSVGAEPADIISCTCPRTNINSICCCDFPLSTG